MLLVLPFISMAGTSVDAAIRDTGMTPAPAPVSASASPKTRSISKSRLKTILSACKKYEGADALFMGSVSTFLLKKLLKLTSPADPDMEKAVGMLKGLGSFIILDYGDCSESDRQKITEKLDREFHGIEALMETRDNGESMQLFATCDEKHGSIRDFVLYAPADCNLICAFGKFSMEDIAKLLEND